MVVTVKQLAEELEGETEGDVMVQMPDGSVEHLSDYAWHSHNDPNDPPDLVLVVDA